jgi:hypothetical protein
MSLVRELIKKYGNVFKTKVQEEIDFNNKPIALLTLLAASVVILDKLLDKYKELILKEDSNSINDTNFDKYVNTYVNQNDELSKLITYSSVNLDNSEVPNIIDICNNPNTIDPIIKSLENKETLTENDFITLAEANTEIELNTYPLDTELNNIFTSIATLTSWYLMIYYLVNKVKEMLLQNDIPSKYRTKYLQSLIKNTYKVNKQQLIQGGQQNLSRITDMIDSLKALDVILIASAIAYAIYKNNQYQLQEASLVQLTESCCEPFEPFIDQPIVTTPFVIPDMVSCEISTDDIPVPSLPFEEKIKNITCDVSTLEEPIQDAKVKEETTVNAIVENLSDTNFVISINTGSYVDTNTILGVNGSTSVYSPVEGYVDHILPNKIYLNNISDPPIDVITENAIKLNGLYAEQNNTRKFLSDYFIKSWYPVMLKESMIRDVSCQSTIFDVKLVDPITGKPVETNFNLGKPDIVATMLFFQGGIIKRFKEVKKHYEKLKEFHDKSIQDITGEDNVKTLAENEQLDKITEDINKIDTIYYDSLINESRKGIIEARVTVPLPVEYQLFEYYLDSVYSHLIGIENPTDIEMSFKKMIYGYIVNRFFIEDRKPEDIERKINVHATELISGFSIFVKNWFEEILRIYNTQGKNIENVKTYLKKQSESNKKMTDSEKVETILKISSLLEFYLETASLNKQFKLEKDVQTLTKEEGQEIDKFVTDLIVRYNELPQEINVQTKKLDDLQLFQTYSIVNEQTIDYRYYAIPKGYDCPALDDEDPYLTSKTSNSPGSMKYWIRYCSIATLTGAANPTTWSTGILLPSGPVTLPVVYIPVKPMSTPWGFIVLGMSVCGLWPFPWILFANYSANHNTPYPDPTAIIKKEIKALKIEITEGLNKFREMSLKSYMNKTKEEIKSIEKEIKNDEDRILKLKTNKPKRQRSADNKENKELFVQYVKDIEQWTSDVLSSRELLATHKLEKFKLSIKFKIIYDVYSLETKIKDNEDAKIMEIKNKEEIIDKSLDKLSNLTDSIDNTLAPLPISLGSYTANFGPTLKNPKPVIEISDQIDDVIYEDVLNKFTEKFKVSNNEMLQTNGSFLSKVDYEKYKKLLRATMPTVIKRDPFPKYENLTASNVWWMSFLVTKWTVVGSKTYGIPGQMPMPV